MITKAAKESTYLEKNKAHIAEFQQAIATLTEKLKQRAKTHDASKLQEPELTQYTEVEEKLEKHPIGSHNYRSIVKQNKPILDKHYKNNPHHPEHFKNGFNSMTILDLVDVFTDWKLDCGDEDWDSFVDSRTDYYSLSSQLATILKNSKNIL